MAFQPPSYYIVTKPNPFLPAATVVRRFDDGYEKVVFVEDEGKSVIGGYEGLVYPHRTLAPFLTAIMKRGLDMGSARQDRRRSMVEVGE